MEMEMEEGLVVVRGRVEIDMRRPFKSVKEAILLFGEKVLAEEVYAGHKLKQQQQQTAIIEKENNHEYRTKVGAMAAELKETKHTLERAKEEDACMAYYLASLKQELEETKSELKQLKSKQEPYYPDIKEIKFIENLTPNHPETEESDDDYAVFDKKRSVKFASPPSLTKVMDEAPPQMQEASPSAIKKKALRKTLIPSLGGIFSRKKGGQSARTSKAFK